MTHPRIFLYSFTIQLKALSGKFQTNIWWY